jgi:hypothetical protein
MEELRASLDASIIEDKKEEGNAIAEYNKLK